MNFLKKIFSIYREYHYNTPHHNYDYKNWSDQS